MPQASACRRARRRSSVIWLNWSNRRTLRPNTPPGVAPFLEPGVVHLGQDAEQAQQRLLLTGRRPEGQQRLAAQPVVGAVD